MKRLMKGTRTVACAAVALLLMATAGHCAQIFYDSFEPPVYMGLWSLGPASWTATGNSHDPLHSQNNHIRTPGVNGIRNESNWRDIMNSQHLLGASYDSNIYLKCWMYEDNDIPWPPTNAEFWPNGYVTLWDSTGTDACMIGVMGEVGRVNGGLKDFFDNCCIYTTTDYYQVLNGDPEYGIPLVPRRQGWRKYTILVNGYTGNAGDVQFFIDDKLVYSGHRVGSGMGGAPFDTIILGAQRWSYATYYWDQAEFGTIETAVNCGTISEAKALPDETWVSLESKVVSGCFGYGGNANYDRPFPGYVTIEESDRSSALWISSSYPANVLSATNQAERINVKGIMRTNEAGMRYLDAIEIAHASDPVDQPGALGTLLKNLGSPMLDGKLVKVWGKVVSTGGQERSGDWRRYFTIDDGSGSGPVKCYYANIVKAKPSIDPEPAVKNGDYVTVVGVIGREVLVPGTTGAEKSVWIRGAGDLQIVLPAF